MSSVGLNDRKLATRIFFIYVLFDFQDTYVFYLTILELFHFCMDGQWNHNHEVGWGTSSMLLEIRSVCGLILNTICLHHIIDKL